MDMQPEEITARCQRIHLPQKVLAYRAERHINTVKSLLNGGTVHGLTRTAVIRVLLEEEISLRDYLLGLHPLPVPQIEEA